MARRLPRRDCLPSQLDQVHLNAAGIDVGSESHFVAVPADRDEQSVRQFGAFTADLAALADWLTECGIETVALESTGVYWIALFEFWKGEDSRCCWWIRVGSRAYRVARRT